MWTLPHRSMTFMGFLRPFGLHTGRLSDFTTEKSALLADRRLSSTKPAFGFNLALRGAGVNYLPLGLPFCAIFGAGAGGGGNGAGFGEGFGAGLGFRLELSDMVQTPTVQSCGKNERRRRKQQQAADPAQTQGAAGGQIVSLTDERGEALQHGKLDTLKRVPFVQQIGEYIPTAIVRSIAQTASLEAQHGNHKGHKRGQQTQAKADKHRERHARGNGARPQGESPAAQQCGQPKVLLDKPILHAPTFENHLPVLVLSAAEHEVECFGVFPLLHEAKSAKRWGCCQYRWGDAT